MKREGGRGKETGDSYTIKNTKRRWRRAEEQKYSNTGRNKVRETIEENKEGSSPKREKNREEKQVKERQKKERSKTKKT